MYSLEDSKSRWEFFQKHQWVSPEFSNSLVFQSWQRCVRLMNAYEWTRPHIASGFTFTSMKRRSEAIINSSIRVLEDSYDVLEGEKLFLFVTDDNGCVMCALGHDELALKMKELGIKEGSFLTEDKIGTNAVSLCIETYMPSEVIGFEHFKRELHDVLTVASPIVDVYGKLLGTVAMVRYVDAFCRENIVVTSSCAKEISLYLHILSEQKIMNSLLSAHNAALDYMEDGVITWDSEQIISYVSPQVGTLLNVDGNTLLGRNIFRAIRFAPHVTRNIEQEESVRRHQTTFEIDDQFVEAVVTYQYSSDGTNLLFIHPVELVEQTYRPAVVSDIRYSFDSLSYTSPQMQHLISVARRLMNSREPILITGDEGVGKEQLALVMHNESHYCGGHYVSFNCGSFEKTQLVEELFGIDEQQSKFELANNGTLHISQIEALNMKSQLMLLKLIDSGATTRSDSYQAIKVNLQLIVSSSKDLRECVEQGQFSRQLYYALSSNELHIPPLRERKDDILALIDKFVGLFSSQHQVAVRIDEQAIELLVNYAWSGNVSQLKNAVNRLLINRTQDTIKLDDIPESIKSFMDDRGEHRVVKTLSLEEIEKRAIMDAWKEFDGCMQDMATALNIGRTTLWRKIKKYQLAHMMNEDHSVE
ncbi:PTS-dependent dihydroxyacetone kinase operon transcriptional regulator DhaR [Vibrio aestuarianus]|uniref:dihydroxyacetone kinase operon transcriptional regulator DhaR n=1 Tax=Vibrio aestuarianus TaxID=28171 RepID=UPI0015584278|nr:PTS-dependent dihydroxyacetone kinase operon transcriptional regulator DhaR [Vibrio aestuarianus]NKZ50879.1 PTS-dependent dihydroxyacetone kinase operon transcriptional regulator DhaR [Vibrio aestuarianus]